MSLFNNIRPFFKIPLKYGFFGAFVGMLLIVVMYYTNRHPFLIPPMYDFRILLFGLFVFFAIKEYKQYYNNGLLNFWQGMLIGFIIYLTIGVLVGLFVIGFAAFVPDFMQGYIDGTIKGMMLDKDELLHGKVSISEETFNQQIAMLKNDTKSYVLAFDYLVKSCFIGFFITILLSVILRRTEDRFKRKA